MNLKETIRSVVRSTRSATHILHSIISLRLLVWICFLSVTTTSLCAMRRRLSTSQLWRDTPGALLQVG